GPDLYVHAVRARLAIRQDAVADGETGQRPAESRGDLREHGFWYLHIERAEGACARRRRRDRDVRALFGRLHRCEPLDQQGQGVRRQHPFLHFLPERPDPDRAHRQAGRTQRRHQWRLRRVRHARFLQECRQGRRRAAGRGALEPRCQCRCAEGERRVQEAYRRVRLRICRRTGRADLHAGGRAGARRLRRSAEGARGPVDARRLVRLCRDGARRQGEVRPRRQECLRPPRRRAVAEQRPRQHLPEGRRPRAPPEDLSGEYPMLETVAQAVINGLLIGGIYALVSIGVTLIFGVVKIVNFAQGEFVMIGMYITFFLFSYFGIDPLLSLFISMPVLFVMGALIQHFLIRRVLGPNDMPQIFLTFALSLLLLNLSLLVFSANYRTVHTFYSDEAFHIAGFYIPVAKLIAFVVAMALSGALWVFLHTTDLGKAMRAASQKPEVAVLMGINPNRVFAVAFGAALALAGAAGSLLMPFYSAYPFVGQVFVLMAFVAVVLGTLGNVVGALIASLMMGVAESLGIQFVGADSGLIVVFGMLLLTLAFKPSGLGAGRVR